MMMENSYPHLDKLRKKTAPLLLMERAEQTPDNVAYRAKNLGIYQERTWRDFRDFVANCAAGFRSLGLKKGERVAIMGDACEEWTISDQAAQTLGAITYGIYPTASVSEVKYQMEHGGASIFIAENQEYVDKILPLLDELPLVRWIVVIDMTAMFMYDHPKLIPYEEILKRGISREDTLEEFASDVKKLNPEDPAFIIYTSGTTGNPKGAIVTHGCHLAGTYNFIDQYSILRNEAHRTVAFLPLGHIMGRDLIITLPLLANIIPHYGEDLEDLPLTLFEVAPTLLFMVPRYLQKFASQILVGIENTTWLKKKIYWYALHVGRRFAQSRWQNKISIVDRFFYWVLHSLAFKPILNKLGFDKLRLVMSGGAPLPRETMALWQIYGVNISELYGQTESGGGMISSQKKDFPRPGDVGSVPLGWQVKLGDHNEILVKSSDLFEGYWKDPKATKAVIDEDGWLHTGDVGEWQGSQLKIIDRIKDFMITAGGKSISPNFIENILRSSPYISEIIVFADNRKYVTALIEIEYDTVSDWALARNVAFTGFTNLTKLPEIQKLLQEEINKGNQELGRVEQIKKFRILPKALDAQDEGDPITPTRKIQRKKMYEKFKALVETMYGPDEEKMLGMEIGSILENAN